MPLFRQTPGFWPVTGLCQTQGSGRMQGAGQVPRRRRDAKVRGGAGESGNAGTRPGRRWPWGTAGGACGVGGSAGGAAGEDEEGDDPGGGQHQAERGCVTAHGGVSPVTGPGPLWWVWVGREERAHAPGVRGGATRARMEVLGPGEGAGSVSQEAVTGSVAGIETPGAASAELTGGPAMTGGIAISHSNHLPQSFRTRTERHLTPVTDDRV